MSSCLFCLLNEDKLLNELPVKGKNTPIRCKKGFYSDKYCIATLTPEQLTKGHTIVVLRKHIEDLSFDVSEKDLIGIISAVNKISKAIKKVIKNNKGQSPERIYVCSLCDGVKHLHFHLIPRYPFSRNDKKVYRKIYTKRDGRKIVEKHIDSNELGGFWYVALREKKAKLPNKANIWKKAKELAEMAKKLQKSRINGNKLK